MEERSRKRLWEDYVFQFLQKIPQEEITKSVKIAAELADDMLDEHDKRWKIRNPGTLVKYKE